MTKEQVEALLAYVDARIEEKIRDALGRDTLHETIRSREFLRELLMTVPNED